MNTEREALREAALFLEWLPQDLGRGSLNGMRVQLQHKIAGILSKEEAPTSAAAAAPAQPQSAALVKLLRREHDSILCQAAADEIEGLEVEVATALAALATQQATTGVPQPRVLHSFSSIDCEKMIAECIPGGSSCDPQVVADAIRRYLDLWQPVPQQAQEPVAWHIVRDFAHRFYTATDPKREYSQQWLDGCDSITPLYAHPPSEGVKALPPLPQEVNGLADAIMAAAERMAYVYASEHTFAAVPAQAEHDELERIVRAALSASPAPSCSQEDGVRHN